MKPFYSLMVLLLFLNTATAQVVEHLYKSYLTSNVVTSVDMTPDGTLLVAAYASGINEMKDDVWKFQEVGNNVYMRVVKASPDGSYWLGGGNYGGLQHFQEGQITQVLSSLNINDILIESDNKMWLSTSGKGIIYYDNGDTTTHLMSQANIPSDYSTGMAKDSKGNLWVGTLQGLAKYDGNAWTQWTTANSAIPAIRIEDVAIDKADNVWIAARDSGVVMFDGTAFTQYYKPEGMMESLCMTITSAENGDIWSAIKYKNKFFGAGINEVMKYSGGEWQSMKPEGSHRNVQFLAAADDISTVEAIGNTIYVGQNSKGGLLKYEDGEWTAYISPKDPRDITFDANGDMWMVADDAGIYKYKGSEGWMEFNCYNAPLPPDGLQDIITLNDSVWVGGVSHSSLIALKDTTWHVGVEGDENGYYEAVKGKNDTLWLGSMGNGLLTYKSDKIALVDSALVGQRILQMAYNAEDNSLWFSGFDTLFHWRDTVLEKFNFEDHGFTTVTDMVLDKEGILWMGSYHGLVKYDGSFSFYTTANSDISYDMIDVLSIDSKDNIWMGLRNADIASFDRGSTWAIYGREEYELPSDHMVCMAIDANDKVFAGYWRTGVVTLDPTTSSIKEASAETSGLVLLPNPSRSTFSVKGAFSKNNELSIYAISGKRVLALTNIREEQHIDISSLECGLYLVQVRGEDSVIFNAKMIKVE